MRDFLQVTVDLLAESVGGLQEAVTALDVFVDGPSYTKTARVQEDVAAMQNEYRIGGVLLDLLLTLRRLRQDVEYAAQALANNRTSATATSL